MSKKMNEAYKRMIKLYTEQRRRILDPEIADANSRNLTRRGHSQFTRGEGGGTGTYEGDDLVDPTGAGF